MGVDARMLVKTRAPVTADQVRDWAYHLASAFGPEKFLLIRPNSPGSRHWPLQHALTIIEEYAQEGLPILPAEGETLIEVNLFGRYYGRHYERGDAPFIISVADWLERRIPGGEIWYGGDNGRLGPFGEATRALLWQHFCEVGHTPYEDFFNRSDDGIKAPVCELCQKPMRRMGWGPKWAMFACSGCSLQLETTDGGETYQEGKM